MFQRRIGITDVQLIALESVLTSRYQDKYSVKMSSSRKPKSLEVIPVLIDFITQLYSQCALVNKESKKA